MLAWLLITAGSPERTSKSQMPTLSNVSCLVIRRREPIGCQVHVVLYFGVMARASFFIRAVKTLPSTAHTASESTRHRLEMTSGGGVALFAVPARGAMSAENSLTNHRVVLD